VPLLDAGLSQRYLRESFSGCLDPYPGGSPGALTRFFPGDDGLHHAESGSALNNLSVPQLLYGVASRGYSHSLMFRPPDLLATQVAPTASRFPSQGSRGFYFHAYLGLLPPRAVDMLAVRNRVTDGAGTSTPQDSRPCWPLRRVEIRRAQP
jgi:hypothetical protein